MTTAELAATFRDRYHNAGERKVAVSVHLFGIEFASDLDGHRLNEICEMASVPLSYQVEIRKGMNLSEYVVLKS